MLKKREKKAFVGDDATVISIPTSRIVLMTIEKNNLVVRLRGAWAANVPASAQETAAEAPSPAGISMQPPDIGAALNGSFLGQDSLDELAAMSDLRKSDLWRLPDMEFDTDPVYNCTRKPILVATKMRIVDAFVKASVSPVGELLAEIAQLEGKLLFRMKKTSDIHGGEVRVHSGGTPRFRVFDKQYCVTVPLILWGESASAVDLTDLAEKRSGS